MNPDNLSPDSENLSDNDVSQDVVAAEDAVTEKLLTTPGSPPSFLPWPPPGLEQIQGTLLPSTNFLCLGVTILILPLLVSIASKQSFSSAGPFGDDWWIVMLTTGLGITIVAEAFHRLFRLLRTGNLAVQQGHGWLTVLQAAADSSRDTGFLLQGARIFESLTPQKRASLLMARLLAVGFYLVGTIWILLGFLLAVFLASRGLFGSTAIWYFTFLPTMLLLILAYYCRVRAALVIRILNKQSKSTVELEVGDQVHSWIEKAGQYDDTGALGRGPVSRILHVRISLIAIILLGIFLFVPVLYYTLLSSASQIVARVAAPRFQGVQDKANLVEMYRPYRLEHDESITPERAGQALQNITYIAGRDIKSSFIRPPEINYEQKWLFGRVRSGITSWQFLEMDRADISREDWTILEREASNPAHQEYGIMARAATADFAGARYILPFPETMTGAGMPIPRFQGISDGAKSHVAKAAYELHTGRPDQAEITLRELISAGFLMMDEEPSLIGNLIGIVITGIGGETLESLYRATGRVQEADLILRTRNEVRNVYSKSRAFRSYQFDLQDFLRTSAFVAKDEDVLRGLRWELMPQVTFFTPCLSLNKILFGPGDDYRSWLEEVHSSLVRWPAEEELFQLRVNNYITSKASIKETGVLEKILGFILGSAGTKGDCVLMVQLASDMM